MTTFHFSKMHGLGNDFVVIETIHQKVSLTKQQIKELADRHCGIGFDQLLMIEPAPNNESDFFYRIFNADGSQAEQCGNGARCIARFIHDHHLSAKKEIRVATKKALHELILQNDGLVSVNMQAPIFTPSEIPFLVAEQNSSYLLETALGKFKVCVLSMGNPHCVLQVDNTDHAKVVEIGACIAKHPSFPQSVNVGFMQIHDRSHISLRVYERGIGETQACGSGACAAVVAGRMLDLLDEKVSVQMLGGKLIIEWAEDENPVWMTGPAVEVFVGRLRVEG